MAPGCFIYKQFTKMSSSPKNVKNINENGENSDYIEEEMLVYVDIEQTSISENEIRNAQCLKIVSNDKSSLLQINNRFFEGNFDYSIGTHVFFEKNENIGVDPLYSRCESQYDFYAKTNKILSMNRVLLKDVTSDDETLPQNNAQSKDSDLKISRTYEQALSLFLTPKRSPPRKVNEDDEKFLMEIIEAQNQNQNAEEVSTLTDAMEQNSIKPES